MRRTPSRASIQHPERPAVLVAHRIGASVPSGGDEVVARGGPPAMGAGFSMLRLAAAGRTTALAFDANDEDGRLGVAIARDGGCFEPVERPLRLSSEGVRVGAL